MTIYPLKSVEKERVMSECMQIYGEVIVRQGKKIVAVGRNKFVAQALVSLCNLFSKIAISDKTGTQALNITTLWSDESPSSVLIRVGTKLTMRLGTNTTTPTTYEMIALVAVIDTAPNSFTLGRDNPSASVYRAIYTATWNAGTVSGTIGEIGLFCVLQKVLGSSVVTDLSITSTLWSRLSSAGGDFGQFTIDPTKPLSVEWRIVFQF